MINPSMRFYDYFQYEPDNGYGQPTLGSKPKGKIKMSVSITSQSIQDNINYQGCQYVGLTHAKVDDTYVVKFGNELLKVLYVNSMGRLNQVFMAKI